ncbi:MAG TPA: hypothetical protein VJ552_02395 [Sediminibacterium sp.]|nr:hypothetical protein [Sediminibacterium sp.]
MTNKHLSETNIQQYVLKETSNGIDIAHIQQCTHCKAKAARYRILFDALAEEEKPSFDFDLAELVIGQLPVRQRKASHEYPLLYVALSIAVFFLCIVVWFFGKNVAPLLWGVTPMLAGLLITTVACLLLFLCIDMYKKYQAKMRALDF